MQHRGASRTAWPRRYSRVRLAVPFGRGTHITPLAVLDTQCLTVKCTAQLGFEMVVWIEAPSGTDSRRPEFERQLTTVGAIGLLPGLKLGHFRIEDQPIKIEDESADHTAPCHLLRRTAGPQVPIGPFVALHRSVRCPSVRLADLSVGSVPPNTEMVYSIRSVGQLQCVMMCLSATAWKCTKTGKMKMWHFSGTEFAVGLAEEMHNPLLFHERRRKRIQRPFFLSGCQRNLSVFKLPVCIQIQVAADSAPAAWSCPSPTPPQRLLHPGQRALRTHRGHTGHARRATGERRSPRAGSAAAPKSRAARSSCRCATATPARPSRHSARPCLSPSSRRSARLSS